MKMLVGKILGSVLNGGNPGNYSVLSTGIRETYPWFISRGWLVQTRAGQGIQGTCSKVNIKQVKMTQKDDLSRGTYLALVWLERQAGSHSSPLGH